MPSKPKMPSGQSGWIVTLNVKNIHFYPQSQSPFSPLFIFHFGVQSSFPSKNLWKEKSLGLVPSPLAIVTCDYANLDYTICFPKRYPFHFPKFLIKLCKQIPRKLPYSLHHFLCPKIPLIYSCTIVHTISANWRWRRSTVFSLKSSCLLVFESSIKMQSLKTNTSN